MILTLYLWQRKKTDFSIINSHVFPHGHHHFFIGDQGKTVLRI